MVRPSRRLLFAASALALPGGVATVGSMTTRAGAQSPAPAVSVTLGCVIFGGDYTALEVPLRGSGFSPSSPGVPNVVTLHTTTKSQPEPKFLGTTQTDASGTFFGATAPAIFKSNKTQDQQFTLIATDGLNPQIVATTTFRQVRAGYTRVPDPKRPEQKVRHVARGFQTGETVWAHFRHGATTQANKRLGVAKGPCGIASRKMRVLPVKRPALGTWKVYVDERKTFVATTRPQARLSFKIVPLP
jgi:hypothetical protein